MQHLGYSVVFPVSTITAKGRKGVPLCCGFMAGYTMEKPSNPQKLKPQGNGRDETVQFIINQFNREAGQLQGDVSSAISAVHPHVGEKKKKKENKR